MPRYLSVAAILLIAAALMLAGGAAKVPPSTFSHSDHGGINCLQCHHDWAETSGRQLCMGCHLGRPELKSRSEAQFHGLCRGCHAERRAEQTGPAARCSGCHLPRERPHLGRLHPDPGADSHADEA